MANTWIFTYYGTFGDGDASDDIEFEAEVLDEEYEFLQKVSEMLELEDDEVIMELDDYLEENEELIDKLTVRLQGEVAELDMEYYDDKEETPTINIRMPWE